MATYPYRPLNLPHETRVLIVQPGNFEDDLICSLSHLNLASPAEPYDALSYCWSKSVDRDASTDPDTEIPWSVYGRDENDQLVDKGGRKLWKDLVDDPYFYESYIRMGGKMPDAPITCNGVTMVVGGELYRALRRLRPKDGPPLRIWVDAVCINQDDIAERNEHVKIMGQVYAGASKTRVWLGESTQFDMHALETLMAISQVLSKFLTEARQLETDPNPQRLLLLVQAQFWTTPNIERLEWGLVAEMLNRAWFKRTWIIQEVANSKNIAVQIGDLEFEWEFLSGVVRAMSDYKINYFISECKAFKAITMMEYLRQERLDKETDTAMSFLRLLEELRDFNATIPSDKIYSVLGLTKMRDEVVVDYALSPEEVFTNFAIQELESGFLDVLSHCVESSKPTTLMTLPSWVPDWTRPGWTEPFRVRELKMAAGGGLKPELTVDRSKKTLRIKGRILDKIAVVEMQRRIPPPGESGPMDGENEKGDDWEEFEMASYGGDVFDVVTGKSGTNTNGNGGSNSQPSFSGVVSPDVVPPERSDEKGEEGDEGGEKKQEKQKTPKDAKYRYEKIIGKIREHNKAWHLSLIDVAFPDKKVTPQTWENLWRTMMCNRTRDNERPSDNCAVGFDIYLEFVLGDKDSEQILQDRLNHQINNHGLSLRDADAYYLRENDGVEKLSGGQARWTYNRRFFRSEAGRFGWCVDGTQPGDVVALFHGCDAVFTLREVGSGQWRIIGDSYIHGLMDGEGCGDEFEAVELQII
ncbi:hypothetical protein CkaCkLH20_10192 [Colletotrichum karsti]|uniref:Heterokaryon incompatibility domain-containing protein n=1 Tax=Colletotrichum karsti TaxID=1095194 RepID=A0A9P6I5H8_9PEZI|nr:uncharacterized protein CkaCkLH20_10192 [Colletotrichum karsti]KAF9872365.1 hypothetical protein CkaCkLH20_10192 [Colletotrichum karsti]